METSTATSPDPKLLLLTASTHKKPQPVPWTPQETTNLIQSYQEKWYSLKKGQLKASQWEEVAITVAARCGYDDPSKTAIQCRHKIEKLRKRYRAEKQRYGSRRSSWQFFDLMDNMERGPFPISARPVSMVRSRGDDELQQEDIQIDNNEHNDEEDDDEDEDDERFNNKLRSISHILRRPVMVNRFAVNRREGGSISRDENLESGSVVKREVQVEEEGVEVDVVGKRLVLGLAAEIRAFAERFVRMENKKMEMMRETEQYRMEMENKRMEMIMESQRKIIDSIGRCIGSHKRLKVSEGP